MREEEGRWTMREEEGRWTMREEEGKGRWMMKEGEGRWTMREGEGRWMMREGEGRWRVGAGRRGKVGTTSCCSGEEGNLELDLTQILVLLPEKISSMCIMLVRETANKDRK